MAPILTIPSGESRACLDLMITEDNSLEYDETFVLSVEPSGDDMSVVMVVGNDNTTITILNDDGEASMWQIIVSMGQVRKLHGLRRTL